MKVWIFNKKSIVKLGLLVFALIFSLILALNSISGLVLNKKGVKIFNENEKKLPIYSVETEKNQVALTFNVAWGNDDVDELLNTLDHYNVRASFFFVGDWVEKYPLDTQKIFLAGHCMGNHSDSHPNMPRLDSDAIYQDIKKCNDRIFKITGEEPRFFRPPSGAYDNKTIEAAESLDMYTIQWDVDSIDWKDIRPEKIVDRINAGVQKGSIILFHTGKKNTQKALPTIIEDLKDKGYTFVTVDELILKDNFYIDHTGRQKKAQ